MKISSLFAAAIAAFPMRPSLAATATVAQSAQAFERAQIGVRVGDHVIFKNMDEVDHNILVLSSDDDEGRDMGLEVPGGETDVLFDKAGTFRIRCHIHPRMKMTVIVQ